MSDNAEDSRSDRFTWKPGDLVPADTPVPSLEERRQALLEKLSPDVRKKVEAVFDRHKKETADEEE